MDKLLKFNNKLIKSGNRIVCQFEKIYNITTLTSDYGYITASQISGHKGDVISLTNFPNTDCSFSQYNITGAVLNGNEFTINDSDITTQGVFTRNVHTVNTQTDGHGTITATPTTGYNGTTVSLSNTPNAGYVFKDYGITGATLTGNQFNIQTNDVTAMANFSAIPYLTFTGVRTLPLPKQQMATYSSGFNGLGNVWSNGTAFTNSQGKCCSKVGSKTLQASITGSDVEFKIINWYRTGDTYVGTFSPNVVLSNSNTAYTFPASTTIGAKNILAFGDYTPIYMTWSARYPSGTNVRISAAISGANEYMFIYNGGTSFS